MRLAETQAAMRAAIVGKDAAVILPRLSGGDPAERLAIHQRHFAASLGRTLCGRFPALAWLVGASFLTQAAEAFARAHPPSRPCIAEYGAEFPDFVARRDGAERFPWIADIGALEWDLGVVALAVDAPALTLQAFEEADGADLDSVHLTLQAGLAYRAVAWPVDRLLGLFLAGDPPAELEFTREDARLEIRGSRGAFRMTRMSPAAFAFRSALAGGQSLGTALGDATAIGAFDAGAELAALFASGLVTNISTGALS